jgi:hypothetical protein
MYPRLCEDRHPIDASCRTVDDQAGVVESTRGGLADAGRGTGDQSYPSGHSVSFDGSW